MTRLQRVLRGLRWGAAAAWGLFLSDLVGAFLAVGWLFDATAYSWSLLAVAAGLALGIGAVAGGLMGFLWPCRWRVPVRRRLLLSAAVVTCVAVAGAGYAGRVGRRLEPPGGPRPPPHRPHAASVLWVVIDTLRADTFYGQHFDLPLTPKTAAFARKSLLFRDVESSAGWTIPSVATLLTGVHNATLDASAGFLPDWVPTIATRVRAAGYETRAVVDNVIMEPRNGFAAGFEGFSQKSGFRFAFSLPSFRLLPDLVRETLRGAMPTSYHGSRGTADAALAIINQERTAPLFLYVHFMDPHAPYYPHPEIGSDPPESEAVNYYYFRDILRAEISKPPNPRELLFLRHRYEGEVRAMDEDVARVLQAWQKRFGEDTMVVVTADHGEEFLEHGRLGHGFTVHREMVHVPLLLRLPEGTLPPERSQGVIATPVTQIDLVPTTLDLLGIDPADHEGPALQGHSWLPWLRGEASFPQRPMVASHSRHGRRTYRLRDEGWVFVWTAFYDDRPTVKQLYNLEHDPWETTNLWDSQREKAQRLEADFGRVARALNEAYDPERPSQAQASLESLRALGYIQ